MHFEKEWKGVQAMPNKSIHRCEVSGLTQAGGYIKCPHPKHGGKYIGYMTCRDGLMPDGNGGKEFRGGCPYFKTGSECYESWCGYDG